MKFIKLVTFLVTIALISSVVAGCGVSKNKYEALMNEKIALEEKLNILTKSKDALRSEYEDILKEKMDLAAKLETAVNEKSALKTEYDKLLDEKVALRASYDKIAGHESAGSQAKKAVTKK